MMIEGNAVICKLLSNIQSYDIQLAEKYRGLGIGTELLELVKQRGLRKRHYWIILTVFKNNKSAHDFYISRSFQLDRTSPDDVALFFIF